MSRVSIKANCDISDINELHEIANNRNSPKQMATRAKIILRSNDGAQNKDIAEELDTSPNLVGKWIKRYNADGIAGLYDLHRSVTKKMDEPAPPAEDRWNASSLANELGVSKDRVWGALRKNNASLDRKRSWEIPTGDSTISRTADIAGIFFSPAEQAVVLGFASGEQELKGTGVFSTKNRGLAEEIKQLSEAGKTVLPGDILACASRHASDNKRFSHMTLVSYMNQLIGQTGDENGLSYAVIYTGNAHVPTKSLRRSIPMTAWSRYGTQS